MLRVYVDSVNIIIFKFTSLSELLKLLNLVNLLEKEPFLKFLLEKLENYHFLL